MGSNFVRSGSSRLYLPSGWREGEVWAARSQFAPRRYFSMMVQSGRFGAAPPTDPDAPGDEIYYLDTTVGAGGDGSVGDPWATLEEARAGIVALHSSLVADTVRVDLICFGATDDSTAVTNTWPTSSTTYYLTLKTPDADRKVQWDAGVYTYARSVSGDTSAALAIGTDSIRLKGLQIFQTGSAGSNFCRAFEPTSLGGELVMDGVKMRGSGGSNAVCFRATNISGKLVLRNCLTRGTIHGMLIGNPTGLGTGSHVILYNCTIIGTTGGGGESAQITFGAGSGRVVRAKNLIMRQIANGVSTTNEDTEDLATNSHASAAEDAGGHFVDPANHDFRIVSSSTYREAGTDLSGVSDWPFNRDASLYTRPYNGTWDQGMHEYRP